MSTENSSPVHEVGLTRHELQRDMALFRSDFQHEMALIRVQMRIFSAEVKGDLHREAAKQTRWVGTAAVALACLPGVLHALGY